MDYSQQEQREYYEFIFKLGLKVGGLQKDFDNLSPENRNRIIAELQQMFWIGGIVGISQHLQKCPE